MRDAINTLRLCERTHLSPLELDECDPQQVADWIEVIKAERFLAKPPPPQPK